MIFIDIRNIFYFLWFYIFYRLFCLYSHVYILLFFCTILLTRDCLYLCIQQKSEKYSYCLDIHSSISSNFIGNVYFNRQFFICNLNGQCFLWVHCCCVYSLSASFKHRYLVIKKAICGAPSSHFSSYLVTNMFASLNHFIDSAWKGLLHHISEVFTWQVKQRSFAKEQLHMGVFACLGISRKPHQPTNLTVVTAVGWWESPRTTLQSHSC